jgi:hypothetical protein
MAKALVFGSKILWLKVFYNHSNTFENSVMFSGEYFGEYTGEIIEDDERENVTYQFAIEEGPGRKHKSFIDARVYGNITR